MPNRLTTFRQRYAKPLAAGALLSAMVGAGPALANPSGATVRSGNVNITNVAPGTLHIEQLTNKAIIDWQKFGIGAGETVRFLQPSQLSAVLNRVIGQDPTKILGNLQANGQVFIVNPNGVLFGPNSQVNVGGLVASTLNITNDDFLNGNYRFTQDQNKALASVVNQGSITITDGGYAVLVAPLVSNEGMIVANLGQVNLMSGESATLNFDGRNLINYDIGHMDAATPGTVVVDRSTVSSLLANVIQDPNLTEAGELIQNDDGTVSLVGGAGTVINEGTIQANGAAGQDAGKIVLDSGRLTVVGSEAVIEASGQGQASNGGEIIALSHGTLKTLEGSTIAARGSDQGGDGGYIDTSGYGRIILEDYADAGASDGEAGTWLIDPEFLAIVSGGGGQLDGNNDTTGLGGQSSSISEDFLEGLGAGTNVILQADTQVTINALADGLLSFQDGVNVTFLTNTGDILYAQGSDTVRVGAGGSISFDAGRDLYLGGVLAEGGATVDIAYNRNLIDQNGTGTTNIVGDFLSFDATQGNLQFTGGNPVEIAGFTNANPLQIDLNVGNGRVVDLISNLATNIDITGGGVLTSGDFQTVPGTDFNIAKAGGLTVNGFQAADVNVTATGNVSGTNLTADNATVFTTASVTGLTATIGGAGAMDGVFDVGGDAVNVTVNDGGVSNVTDLTVRLNGGAMTLAGTTATGSTAGDVFTYTEGANDNDFTLIDSANTDFEIGLAPTGSDISLSTGGSILNTNTNVISADSIELITTGAGEQIGVHDDAVGLPIVLVEAPILVQGEAGPGTPTGVNVSVVDGQVNVQHTDGAANVISFNDPDDINAGEADLLRADDPGAVSFTSVGLTRTGAGDIIVGQLGTLAAPLTSVNLSTTNGSILNSTILFAAGDTNIFSGTINMVALGGSVGLLADPIEVSSSNITAQGTNGVFIANQQDLEVFSLITDAGGDASITATNGSLLLTGGVLSTPLAITDIVGGQEPGDTDGDGYDVTLDVTITGGNVDLGPIDVDGNSGTNTGAAGRALVRVVNQNGDILNGGLITVGDDTDVTLRSDTGAVGVVGDAIQISTTADSAGELLLDAVTSIDLDQNAGDFDVMTIQHDNANVFVQGSGADVFANPNLTINGIANVSEINYINRTGNIPMATVTAGGSDVNITASSSDPLMGNVTGVVDGADDIVAGANTVTVNATGNFSADASSDAFPGAGSLEIGMVGGNVTLRNNNDLELNTAGAGTIGGTLAFDNDADLVIGDLTVGGAATFTNSNSIAQDFDGATDLAAASLTITADAVGTIVDIDTQITDFITLNDCIADGGGNALLLNVFNDGAFNTLNVNSDSTDDLLVSTDGFGGTETVTLADGVITANNPQITTINIDEKTDNVTTAGTASFNNSDDVTINASNGTLMGDYDNTGVGAGNLTLLADGLINVTTTVENTLTMVSQTGTITFIDDQAGGPDDLLVNTVAGQVVDGEWNAGADTMDYSGAAGVLDIIDAGADTNVTFETGTGNILVNLASVGDCDNDLTLIASDASDSGATVGQITDNNGAALNIEARNATLLAVGDIGGPSAGPDALEVDVCDTLTARSDFGGVFTASVDVIDHVIIDVNQSDYNVTFAEYDGAGGASGNIVTIDYTGGSTQTLTLTNSGGGQTATGTDLTLIERGVVDVEIGTTVDNTGNGDNDADVEFIRIISGGGITNTSTSTLISDSGDLIAEGVGGSMGTLAAPILFSVQDLCVSANGRDITGFVENLVTVRNLYLSVNQSTGGTGDVNVIWDEGGTTRGVSMTGTVLDTVSDQAGTVAGDAGSSTVVVSNGAFALNGAFDPAVPSGNSEDFFRINDSLQAAGGGDVTIGRYVGDNSGANPFGLDSSLEVQARSDFDTSGFVGNIIQQAGGFIDLTNGGASTSRGTVTLVSEEGAIGTIAAPIQIISDDANTTIVNAYTGNEDATTGGAIGTDDNGDININATNDVEYRQVIGGTDLTFVAPFHDNNANMFSPGGVTARPLVTPGATPPTPPREGDVIITSDGEICATDISGGADSDVMVESTGAGDILIGTIAANDGTVSVTNFDGNIDEKLDNTDGNIFAQEFIGTITGTGSIGDRTTDKLTSALDIVVLESSLFVGRDNSGGAGADGAVTGDGGDVYLRNIGNIIYNDVRVRNNAGNGEVYLVSEGVTTAGELRIGATSDVDLLVETLNGSQLLIGNVEVVSNTAAFHSSDAIRADALDLNDNPFTDSGRIQADNVLLLANGNIGANGAPGGAADVIQLEASIAGGTVIVAADTSGTATPGVSPTTAGPNRGSVFLAGLNQTDVEVGSVVETICNLQADGVANAINVCIEVTDGTLDVNQNIHASNDIALEASGDVTLTGTITGTGNNDDIGIESTTGAIVDGNGAGDNIVTNDGNIALRAGTSIGDGDAIEIRNSDNNTIDFAADAQNGNLDVEIDTNGGGVDVENFSGGGNPLKDNTAINGVSSTGDICLDIVSGDLELDSTVAGGGDIYLAADGDIAVDSLVSTTANNASVILEASAGSITDGNNNALNIDAGTGGDVILLSLGGGVGSAAGGGTENALEIDAETLAAAATNGDINVTDVDNDSDGLELVNLNYTLKSGGGIVVVPMFATDDVCIETNNGRLLVTEAILAGDNVALEAQGDVILNALITANGDVGIESQTGAIIDGLGAATNIAGGQNVALAADGNIGVTGDALEIEAVNFAADSTNGSVVVNDVDGGDLNIVQFTGGGAGNSPLKSNSGVTGVQAANEVCLETAGALTVDQDIQSDNLDVILAAGGTVLLNDTVTAAPGRTISVETTGGDILDGNGAGQNLVVGGGTVVMSASGTIGTVTYGISPYTGGGTPPTVGDGIEIQASQLAAEALGGDVNIVDTLGSLDVVGGLATLKNTNPVDGVNATEDVCLDVTNGALNINAAIVGTTGDVELASNGGVGPGINVGAGGSVTAGNRIAAQTTGDIIDGNGIGTVAFDATPAGTIVLEADNIRGAAVADDFELETDILAIDASGDVNYADTTGVTSGTGKAAKRDVDITGINVGGALCQTIGGDFVVGASVVATNSYALDIGGDLIIGDGAGPDETITVNGAGGILSLEAGGSIIANNGAVPPVGATADLIAENIVLSSGTGIGNDAASSGANPNETGNELAVNATNFAAAGGTGDVRIVDVGGGINITELTTVKNPNVITGVTAGGDICIDARGGGIQLDDAVVSDGTDVTGASSIVALRANDNIDLANGLDAVTKISAVDKVSIESVTGRIVGANTGDGSADIETTGAGGQIVIQTDGSIGSAGAGNQLEIDTENLAARSVTAGVFLQDLTGDVLVTEIDLEKGGATITGITGIEDVCLEVTGALTVGDNITAGLPGTGRDVILVAGGDVTLGDGAGDVVTAQGPGGQVSIISGGEISQDVATVGTATVVAENVLLDGATGVGTTADRDVEIEADVLTADGGTGDVNVIDRTGDLELDTLAAVKGGTASTIDGVEADLDVCIDVIAGGLTLTQGIGNNSAPDNIAVRALDDIDFNNAANVTLEAVNTISVRSENGGITGTVDDNVADFRTTDAAGSIVISTDDAIGASGNDVDIETTFFAAETRNAAAAGIFVEDLSGDLTITELTLAKGDGPVTGVQTVGEICIETSAVNGGVGDLTVERIVLGGDQVFLAAAGDINNNIVDGGASTGENIQAANANGFVILEAGDEITDGSNDDNVTNGGGVVADNVILASVNGVGNSGAGGDMEVSATNLAATSTTAGDVNIDENSLATTNVEELQYTDKGGTLQTVTGVSAAADVCIDTADALNINEDVVGGTGGAASEVAILAGGTVTIDDDGADANVVQVSNATADVNNRISIQATAGDIVDNNGVGNAATDANGGDVVLSAAAGTIGTTDFAGAGADVLFEINANRLAATSNDDVNILDLDTNADGLDIETLALGKGGGNVTGVSALNDICIDVVNGDLDILADVVNTAPVAGSGIALRTQDDDNDGDGDINVGAFVTNQAVDGITSVDAADEILDTEDGFAVSSVDGDNVVLRAQNGIGTNGIDLEVDANNLAAVTEVSGDINIEAQNALGTTVTVTAIDTLKAPQTVTGISAAEDVCLDVNFGDNLQIDESIISGTDAGATGNINIEVDGNVTIGDGAGGEQVMTTDVGQTVVIDAGGNITDNNDFGTAAVSALGGDVIFRAGGSVGDAVLSTGVGVFAAGQAVEIDADDLAAQAAGDVNVLDLDSNDDGLDIEELTFNDKAGAAQTVNGVEAGQDVCIEVVNGALDVNDSITATAGGIALQTRDADFDADANINFNGIAGEDVTAATRVSVDAFNSEITDTVDGGGTIVAPEVVLVADRGIGDEAGTFDVEIDATDMAAVNFQSGNVNIQDIAGGVNVVEDLFTLKDGLEVDGITGPADICLDVIGDLNVNADITAGGNVAIESTGNIVLGDAAGAQDGLITSGNAGGVASTVSIEATGNVTDGNVDNLNIAAGGVAGAGTGDLVVDAASFGVADQTVGAPASIEVEVARVAGQATAGDFAVDDETGDLEVAENLSTLKTPTTFSGITATAGDICVDAMAGVLNVNADITTDQNVALAAGTDVVLGDAAAGGVDDSQAGIVTAGGAGFTVSVEARGGMVQDGQADDAGPLVQNINNRGGDVILRGTTGVGGEDDALAGARPDDEIEIDATRFAANGGTGDVRVHDIDTDADGLTIANLVSLKDQEPTDGIITAVDICLTVDNTDIFVDEDITAGGNVALRTNLNIILGDDGVGPNGPTTGIITAGNDANRVGTISLEAVNGSVTDNNAGINLVALGDGGTTATGGNIVINAGGGIGSDAAGGADDNIETDTLNFAANAGTGDVNIDELDTNTQDGLTIAALTTIKQGGTLITGVTAGIDVCIDVQDGDLRINENVTANTGDIALETLGRTNSGNGDIIFGDMVGVDVVTTLAADRTVSVEAFGDAVDNNGAGNSAIIATGDNSMVIFEAEDVASVTDVDAFELDAGTLSASASDGNVLVDDRSNGLRVIEKVTLKGGDTITGVTATGDVCIDVLETFLEVDEDIIAGDDVALRAGTDITLGDDGVDNGEGTTTGTVTAGNDAAEVGNISVEALAGSITDGNGDGAVTGDNLVALGNGGVTGGDIVLKAAGGIGSDAAGGADDAIDTDTLNIAAMAGTGDVNIDELDFFTQDGLTITELTTGKDNPMTVTGITAGIDVCVDVLDGDMRINEDVTAGNNVVLQTLDATPAVGSNGDIIFGDDNTVAAGDAAADQVTAGGTVSVQASGDAVDNNGTGNAAIVTPGSVVITADDIASVNDTDAFEIEASVLAARADDGAGAGNVFIDDLTGDLQVDAVDALKTPERVVGVQAADDICIEVLQGSLDVDEAIVAGQDVALRANGNVDLGDAASEAGISAVIAGIDIAAEGTVSIEATNGNITDGNGDGIGVANLNVAAINAGNTGGGNVVLKASGGIGSDATGSDASENDLEIDTLNFAAQAGTGDVNIVETDENSQDGLTIGQLDTLKGPIMTVTGVSAGDDVCIDVLDGDMRITENITANVVDDATAGDVSLRAQQLNGVTGTGSIFFGDGDGDVVSATGAGSVVSVEAAGGAVDSNGAGVAAINTDRGGAVDNGSVVFVADGVIGDLVGEAFELQTGTIAGDTFTNAAFSGDFLVDDLTGNLDIGTLTTGKGGVPVTGIFAANNVCVDVFNGDLDVNDSVVAFGDAQLRTGSAGVDEQDIRINAAGGVSSVFADVAIVATGDILDNNGAGNAAASSSFANVILDGDSVTSSTTTEAFEIEAAALAGRATDGRFHVTDLDAFDDGLALVGTPVPGPTDKFVELTSITATQDICIETVNGDMEVNVDVTAGTEVALRTQDGDNDNDGNVNVNNIATVEASGGRVTVDAAEDIVDNNGQGDPAFVASTNVVLDAGDEIRSTAVDGVVEIEAVGLAARAGMGGINVADLTGNLQIVQDTTIKGNALIDGVTAPGDICLDVRAGDMDVAQQVTSTNGNVALQATGSITLSGADSVAANRATGTVSVEAGTEVADTGAGSFTGQNVVFESTTGVGNNNTVTIEADNLAAAGGTGRVDIQDTAGGVRVTSLDTLKGGDSIVGVQAAQDVCLQATGGDLTIDEVINAGTIAAITADGNIASNATTTGTNKVSVAAGGDITDGNGNGNNNFVGSDVVISADGNIGADGNLIDIDSDRVAAQSTNGRVHLNETAGNLTVATLELEKNGGTVAGINAGTDICLTADDGTVTYTGQTIEADNEIAIRTRDTLVTGGRLVTGVNGDGNTGRVSIEVTDGGVTDGNVGFDIESADAVISANGDVGSQFNPIDTNVDRLAVAGADINIYEVDGLKITSLDLAKAAGTVNGMIATGDIRVEVGDGDLELDRVESTGTTGNGDIALQANRGNILDCNGNDPNIVTPGDVDLTAPNGCVGENGDLLEINAGGTVTIIEKNPDGDPNDGVSTDFRPINVDQIIVRVFPPGTFAQDNYKLGETSFYLDTLYGWLEPEELELIIDELNAYDYLKDGDFLLEKHPVNERDNNKEN